MAQLTTRKTSFDVIEIAGLVMSRKSLLDKDSLPTSGLRTDWGIVDFASMPRKIALACPTNQPVTR